MRGCQKAQEARALASDELVRLFMDPNQVFDHTWLSKPQVDILSTHHQMGFDFDPYWSGLGRTVSSQALAISS